MLLQFRPTQIAESLKNPRTKRGQRWRVDRGNHVIQNKGDTGRMVLKPFFVRFWGTCRLRCRTGTSSFYGYSTYQSSEELSRRPLGWVPEAIARTRWD